MDNGGIFNFFRMPGSRRNSSNNTPTTGRNAQSTPQGPAVEGTPGAASATNQGLGQESAAADISGVPYPVLSTPPEGTAPNEEEKPYNIWSPPTPKGPKRDKGKGVDRDPPDPDPSNPQPLAADTDPATGVPGQLTARNLSHLNAQNAGGAVEKAAAGPDPNDALKYARKFLSSEDFRTHAGFDNELEKIDTYLRQLSDWGTTCDLSLYAQVQSMVRVHRERTANPEEAFTQSPVDFSRFSRFSQRLPTSHGIFSLDDVYGHLRDDHPPFSLDASAAQKQFISDFQSAGEDGFHYRQIERTAYSRAIQQPDSPASPTLQDDNDDSRAMVRGRRRAFIQIGLNAMATGEEQHYAGGWQYRVVALPRAPLPLPLEPQMFLSAHPESQQMPSSDPFQYTNKYIQFQKDKRFWQFHINDERRMLRKGLEQSGARVDESTEPLVFENPTHKQEILRARNRLRLERLTNLYFELIMEFSIEDFAIGSASSEVLNNEETSSKEKLVTIQNFASLDEGAAVREGLRHGFGGAPLSVNEITRLRQALKDKQTSNITYADTDDLVARLGRELGAMIRQLHREDESYASLRRKLQKSAREIASIRNLSKTPLLASSPQFSSILDIAQPLALADGNPGYQLNLTYKQACRLLQDKIVQENHRLGQGNKLDFAHIWSFVHDIPPSRKRKRFFSLDKWPTRASENAPFIFGRSGNTTAGAGAGALFPETPGRGRGSTARVGTGPRPRPGTAAAASSPFKRPKVSAQAAHVSRSQQPPPPHAPQEFQIGKGTFMPQEMKDFEFNKHRHVLYNPPDLRERHIKGLPVFPFGETRYHERLEHRLIEEDLAKRSISSTKDQTPQTRRKDQDLMERNKFQLPDVTPDLDVNALKTAGVFIPGFMSYVYDQEQEQEQD